MECQICMETKECENVTCGSDVPHYLCFGCERTWRSKMPLRNGLRTMTCPTCRKSEKYRTIESLQREAQSKTLNDFAQAADALLVETLRFVRTSETAFIERTVTRVHELTARPSTVREPTRARCASGRCRSTSRTGRAMTYLKCNICHNVFCCRACRECVGCRA
jgi:hypothetical protein